MVGAYAESCNKDPYTFLGNLASGSSSQKVSRPHTCPIRVQTLGKRVRGCHYRCLLGKYPGFYPEGITWDYIFLTVWEYLDLDRSKEKGKGNIKANLRRPRARVKRVMIMMILIMIRMMMMMLIYDHYHHYNDRSTIVDYTNDNDIN